MWAKQSKGFRYSVVIICSILGLFLGVALAQLFGPFHSLASFFFGLLNGYFTMEWYFVERRRAAQSV